MKHKIRNLLIIVFFCIFVYPLIYYFIQSVEPFSSKDAYGQWELLLRQSYNDQYIKSPFSGIGQNVNIDALYDESGKINIPNYYNSELFNKYNYSDKYILKLNIYNTYELTTPTETIEWTQSFGEGADPPVSDHDSFTGLIKSTDSSYVFKGVTLSESDDLSTDEYVIGASQTYLDETDISYIPGFGEANGVEKVELYMWNPRPNDKNTYNGNYKNISISKVDMNESKYKNYWNKSEDISGLSGESDDRFSYCIGKLKCNDNAFSPVKNSDGNYKPYCDSDSSLNPVYCEGSALYNTQTTTLNPVTIGEMNFDMMGKYATIDTSNESFNLFRGLTTPYDNNYVDPEISGNDVIMYDPDKSTFVKNNICNFLNNENMINGTNIQEECIKDRPSHGSTDGPTDVSGTKCMANYGDTINSKYKDYVCKQEEACIGYECGVKFGKCSPALI